MDLEPHTKEQNYVQVEKEEILLATNHKPLTTILSPKAGLPALAAARLQRWAIMLSAYQYDIEFWPTHKYGNADCL